MRNPRAPILSEYVRLLLMFTSAHSGNGNKQKHRQQQYRICAFAN